MMTLEQIANGLGNADRQGADTDEPEGARFITISETLLLQMVHGLGGVRGQICNLEERIGILGNRVAELVAINEALEHRLGDPT